MDMQIEDIAQGIEPVTKTDILALDTWNQGRSAEQIRGFLASREAILGNLNLDEE